MTYTIEQRDDPADGDRNLIADPLIAYNASQVGNAGFSKLALLVRDAAGLAAGGLWARVAYDWMFVELLVVPEALRGGGIGRALMRQADEVAVARGCVGVWLDTFSFQARPFYEKLGYEVFGVLPDHPRGGELYILRKRLAQTATHSV